MSELNLAIRFLRDPNVKPILEVPYDPAKRLDDAACAYSLDGLPEELDEAICEHLSATDAAAFDRGFRTGARMVLQILQQ